MFSMLSLPQLRFVKLHLRRRAIIRSAAAALCLPLAAATAACDPAGRHVFATADGGSVSLQEQHGKWTLINYWAIWCAPCREEIPELNRLAEEYGDRVTVLGVNMDYKRGAALRSDLQELGIRFPVLVEDPGPVLGWPPPQVVPTTWILDSAGRPERPLLGPQTLSVLLKALNLDRDAVREASP